MNRILKMQNAIQPYAWGSRTAIAELLGEPTPSDHPQAELWMGAHPKASSKVWYQGRWQSLDDLIRQDPDAILGPEVTARFGTQFPFLFKVLAADHPLSLQVHPSKTQACQGVERENQAGIPFSAPHRNYKDRQHKPEIICALTLFWGLSGFRPLAEMVPLLAAVWPAQQQDALKQLTLGADQAAGLAPFFSRLMTLSPTARQALIAQVVASAGQLRPQDRAYDWLVRLNDAYPGDIGVLAPILLNLVCLQPGEAVFLPSGQLHAYLSGAGIELMANSDNVLRGGLTAKHIDVPELLKVLDFQPRSLKILKAQNVSPNELRYPSEAEEFVLSVLEPTQARPYVVQARPPIPEILLCTAGAAQIVIQEGQKGLELPKGRSVLIAAGVRGYTLSGQAVVYKAAVNV